MHLANAMFSNPVGVRTKSWYWALFNGGKCFP
jgi:hypothetical protein